MVITHPWWFCQVGGESLAPEGLPVPPGKPAGGGGSCQLLERDKEESAQLCFPGKVTCLLHASVLSLVFPIESFASGAM